MTKRTKTEESEDPAGIDAMIATRVPGTEVAPAAADRPVATVTIVIVEITAIRIVETVGRPKSRQGP